MDSKLNQWIRIKTALEELNARKKELTDMLKEVENTLIERHLSDGKKVIKEGYSLQVVSKPVAIRMKKTEKISMMAGSLIQILKNPPNDKEVAVKNMLEAGKSRREDKQVLVVKKVKEKD